MGPLAGLRVVELTGIGPGPMAAMLLADMGATVLRIDRPVASGLGLRQPVRTDLTLRGRHALALDLKDPRARELVLRLVAKADALIEGFRPGVAERLGLGPEPCLARNPRLAYGRMTGWGQEGPLAHAAGHDLNYIALAGALHHIGRAGEPPVPPLNLVGDYGGGSLYLAFGLVCAMLEASRSGRGQVVDAAIVDGTAHLMTAMVGLLAAGMVPPARGQGILDGAAPFYDCYECADARYVAVAPLESKFFDEFLRRLGFDPQEFPAQADRSRWPEAKAKLQALFRTRPRDEWCALLEGTDACFAPVLTPAEAMRHPHMKARGAFVEQDGIMQPAPAPRFSRTVPELSVPPQPARADLAETALAGWLTEDEIAALRAEGTLEAAAP